MKAQDMHGNEIKAGDKVKRHPLIGIVSNNPKIRTVLRIAPLGKEKELMIWFKEGGGAHHPKACEVIDEKSVELPLPVTDKMILENLIDEKNREIEGLQKKLSEMPKPLTEEEWGKDFLQCNNIGETFDLMVKHGFVIEDKSKNN